MEYQVELIDIAKHYQDFVAIDGVNLNIKKGEIVSLLGGSGCGKTTTLRLIAGLIEPTHGKIFIQGEDMSRVPPYKRDISMVFQNYALFPHMTVYENIVYGLRMRKIKDKDILMKKAQNMMQIVQLENVGDRYPRELSGGQQQRVSLARAMIVEPKVMLFDEPLSNLDAKLREETRVEIRALLKQMGATAVYVTHDQEEALTISDRIAVMHDGHIEQITEPDELYKKPATRYIANFVGHADFFEGIVADINGERITIRQESGRTFQAISESAGKYKIGDDVTFVVRPENIRISKPDDNEQNILSGIIRSRIYLGSTIRYVVSIEGCSDVECDLRENDACGYSEGDHIDLHIEEKDFVLVNR